MSPRYDIVRLISLGGTPVLHAAIFVVLRFVVFWLLVSAVGYVLILFVDHKAFRIDVKRRDYMQFVYPVMLCLPGGLVLSGILYAIIPALRG